MLLVNENSTEQINAALLDIDNNIEKRTKTSLISGIISAVYGAVKVMFEELKKSLARVAYTGSYTDLTDTPNIPNVTDTVASGNMDAVTSNAVKTELTTNYYNKQSVNNDISNLNITNGIPSFSCRRGGSFTVQYIIKQTVGVIHHYFGKVTMGNDAAGGNVYMNIDGLNNGNGWEIVGKWYIPDTDYNGMIFCLGTNSIWLQKGYTTGGTRITSTEIQGKTVFFDFVAFKQNVSTISE